MDESLFVPDHVHFIATVILEKPIRSSKIVPGWLRAAIDRLYGCMGIRRPANPLLTARHIRSWLTRLVAAVDMEILAGPYVIDCLDPGNEGVTGIVVLSTSHCSMHIWDQVEQPYLMMDLYSCKRFQVDTILRMLKELGALSCEYDVIDRNHQAQQVLLSPVLNRVDGGAVSFSMAA